MPTLRTVKVRVCFSPFSTGPKLRPRGGVTWKELYTAVRPTRMGGIPVCTDSPLKVSKTLSMMPSRSGGMSKTPLGAQVTVMVFFAPFSISSFGQSTVRKSRSAFRMPSS